MSALIHLKHILLSSNVDPRMKSVTLDLLNAINTDLDEQGYEHSSNVDEAIAAFDKVLIEMDEEVHPTPGLVADVVEEEENEISVDNLLGGFDPTAPDEEENDDKEL